ncbi:MAG: shikimate dehydrogenase [Pseudomonadota bacterium]
MKNLCRVFGNPISQSKSPLIHSLFAKQFDLDLRYDKCTDGLESFEDAVAAFFTKAGAIGANVTLPFKQRAYDYADELSPHALRSGAVNTLYKRKGIVYGDNTDGRGLVWDLKRHNIDINGLHVLLIGAGGAAQGCIPALFDAGIEKLDISNRTVEKAQQMIDQLKTNSDWNLSLFNETQKYDLIINATSLSLSRKVPEIKDEILSSAKVCYDMVYLDEPTAFMQYANRVGVEKTIDGIGMLVGQAAESFRVWFDLSPDLNTVVQALKTKGNHS